MDPRSFELEPCLTRAGDRMAAIDIRHSHESLVHTLSSRRSRKNHLQAAEPHRANRGADLSQRDRKPFRA
jgi:hypothetical protein